MDGWATARRGQLSDYFCTTQTHTRRYAEEFSATATAKKQVSLCLSIEGVVGRAMAKATSLDKTHTQPHLCSFSVLLPGSGGKAVEGGGRDTVPKRKHGAALVGGSEWVLVVQRALALLNASHGPSSLSPLDVR